MVVQGLTSLIAAGFISGILPFTFVFIPACPWKVSCTCCCDVAADTTLSALRLGSFRTAQTSQMLAGKISLLHIIVICFAHGIYMNCGIRKGWVMAADALLPWGSFEANFEYCFHRSPHSGGHLQLPGFASTCSHPPSFVHPPVS